MGSIGTIQRIPHRSATKLRKNGVRTTEALLKRGADRKGRRELAEVTGIEEKLITDWVNCADMMRVKGIGEEYAELLEAAGVDTLKALKRRNATNLLNKMVEVNRKRKLVRRLPTELMVVRWIEHATELEPIIVA
jgi:hypothetical protein